MTRFGDTINQFVEKASKRKLRIVPLAKSVCRVSTAQRLTLDEINDCGSNLQTL